MLSRVDLISLRYVRMQEELHQRPGGYGGKGRKWAPAVAALVARYQASSVLDYGCGQGSLAASLRELVPDAVRVSEYDPAIPIKAGLPVFADLVTCTDVLEHIEPEHLVSVLRHLRLLARKAVLLVVALDPTNKILSDGRNAHLIQESPEWWAARVQAAGFRLAPIDDLPLPVALGTPEKRSKRWIAVAEPEPLP